MARLLFLTHEFAPFRGGIATVVEGLAAGAATLGHDVHVLAPDYHVQQHTSDGTQPFAVHRFPGDFCSILSIDRLTRFARHCRLALRAVRADAVLATDPQSQMALTLLARLGLARDYAFLVHGTELLRYRSETMPRVWMHGAFRRPRTIVTVSHAVRRLLLDSFAVDASRTFVSWPGIAPRWLNTPPTERAVTRHAWKVSGQDIVLITVARRVPEKGHRRVIDALALLPADMRMKIAYVIVGTGPASYAEGLQTAAMQAGVRVELTGELSDDAALAALDAADVFVMPSLRTPRRLEGFGLAYLEAAARGLPAIATDTGGVAEAVRDGETGILLAEAARAPELARAIDALVSDPEARARLGTSARAFARQFTRERHAAEVCSKLS